MVTAELAVALPTLVVVVLAALYAVAAVTAQLRCTDAAGAAARLAARGEPAAVVRRAASETAPQGARLVTMESATAVTATVTVSLRPPGLGHLLPGLTLTAHATDAREPADPDVPS